VVQSCHLKLLATLKQRLVINLPFFLNAMLQEIAARTQKAKYRVTIISHHGLVKLVVNKALSQTQIAWGDLIEANRPLQLEQPKLHHGNTPQGIEAAQERGDTTQMEVPQPQLEIETAWEGRYNTQMEVPLPQTEIETTREGRDNTQEEVPLPQLENEADPIQLVETQTSLEETPNKRRKSAIDVPENSTMKRIRRKRIAQFGED
jgi:hypothetical protein